MSKWHCLGQYEPDMNWEPSEWREATEEDIGDDACSPDIHLQTITVDREEKHAVI